MLQGIARLAIGAPKRILAVVVLVMIGTAIFGIPVTKSLSAGGMQNPASESSQAATRGNWWAPKPLARLHDRFGLSEAAGHGSHAAQSPAEVG